MRSTQKPSSRVIPVGVSVVIVSFHVLFPFPLHARTSVSNRNFARTSVSVGYIIRSTNWFKALALINSHEVLSTIVIVSFHDLFLARTSVSNRNFARTAVFVGDIIRSTNWFKALALINFNEPFSTVVIVSFHHLFLARTSVSNRDFARTGVSVGDIIRSTNWFLFIAVVNFDEALSTISNTVFAHISLSSKVFSHSSIEFIVKVPLVWNSVKSLIVWGNGSD